MRKPPAIDHEAVASFPLRWINRDEAMRLVNRDRGTLWRWEKAGLIRKKTRAGKHVFEAGELLRARDERAATLDRARFQPGHPPAVTSGRPRHPARPRIAELLENGRSLKQIVAELHCTASLVRRVKSELTSQNEKH